MELSAGAFALSKQSTLAGKPLDRGCRERGKKQHKGNLIFPKIPKDYKPSAKVLAMTCGPLPKDFDLDKELDEMWEERAR